jgi:hypothetical protein
VHAFRIFKIISLAVKAVVLSEVMPFEDIGCYKLNNCSIGFDFAHATNMPSPFAIISVFYYFEFQKVN